MNERFVIRVKHFKLIIGCLDFVVTARKLAADDDFRANRQNGFDVTDAPPEIHQHRDTGVIVNRYLTDARFPFRRRRIGGMVDNSSLNRFRFAIHRASDVIDIDGFGPVDVIARVVFKQFSDGVNIKFFLQHRRAPRPDAFEILQRVPEYRQFVYIC